ncbi:SUMF1/EgtB/PvdO family nonheme iron enzyme [bacterium]|nr:SUMF1/EgtB/PvdO family nonheme iron enzyme [bacterium]
MSGTNCIPDPILPALLEGLLSDEESLLWEEHLLQCPQCLERTRNLTTSQTVAGQSHDSVPPAREIVDEPISPSLEALMQRLSDRSRFGPIADAGFSDTPTVRPESEAPTDIPPPRTISNHPPVETNIGELFGPYRILAKLGEGGMGAVYQATHVKLDKLVAVKVLSPKITKHAEAVARFEREMRAVGKLNHPHIVQAYDAGEINGIHYLTMEFVDGTDLFRLVKDTGPLSVVNACKIVQQLASALSAAHAAGLVHRDIKPSNLLVGKHGEVKLLDLGLALLADEKSNADDLTTAGQAFGTPDYMAPEQWEDAHSADARTDLYALGCTLFFLLVGYPPYGTEKYRSAVAKMKGHVNDPTPDLKSARPDVPDEVTAIYQQLMAKVPADRIQTAAEVVLRLGRFISSSENPVPATSAAAPLARNAPASGDDLSLKKRSWFYTASAVGGLVVLLAVIVVTITRKNGVQSTIIAPEGVPIHVNAPPDATINITQQDDSLTSTDTIGSRSGQGWHGWPADAPKPAIAPFDAAQAIKHQQEWAAYLQVPVEYTNSIGMKFRLIPPGEFLMGSTDAEIDATLAAQTWLTEPFRAGVRSEAPQHRVIITKPYYLGVYEVTERQYLQVMQEHPEIHAHNDREQPSYREHHQAGFPLMEVTWEDSVKFCNRLCIHEGLLPTYTEERLIGNSGYALPTESQWENACRAGTASPYWNGDGDKVWQSGWSYNNSEMYVHAVGELKANPYGLFDITGNLFEWCQDRWSLTSYAEFQSAPAIDPVGPSQDTELRERVQRGGSWHYAKEDTRSAARRPGPQTYGDIQIGVRLALTVDAVQTLLSKSNPTPPKTADQRTSWQGWPADAPEPAIAPFDASQAKTHQQAWAAYLKVPAEYTNSNGMKFRLIPPGEFLMGSTETEIEDILAQTVDDENVRAHLRSESPQHRVVVTKPYYFGVYEATENQYRQAMGKVPAGHAQVDWDDPRYRDRNQDGFALTHVTWQEAAEFCGKLCELDNLPPTYVQGLLVRPMGYVLPTEAEWEFACRAGTQTGFWCGDIADARKQAGWCYGNSEGRVHRVGELNANPFGLYDTIGNLFEYCQDRWSLEIYRSRTESPVIDPAGVAEGEERVIRSGSWAWGDDGCRSASRRPTHHSYGDYNHGVRIVLTVDAVKERLQSEPASTPLPEEK